MVAIVSGNSLGLSLTSLGTLATLGTQGQRSAAGASGAWGTAVQGRSGEAAYVNAANGNLVLQDRDDLLVGRGLDLGAVRTYNSQGLLADDNADNWQVGAFGQSVRLASGTAGTAGSTLGRTDREGAVAVYTWDAASSRYQSPAGAGAFDTVTLDAAAGQWVWRDGDTARVERYGSTGAGRLISATDADGATARFTYDVAGNLQSATSANGDISYFDYVGSDLTQIRSVSGGVTTTTVRYAYDASHRLASVTVDLTPEDNAVADGRTYVTRYTYDGASRRVASVAEADGTVLAFTYVLVGSNYQVQSVTDALGAVTRFAYDAALSTTTVTDPLGAQSVYRYDAKGQLVQVRQGVTAGNAAGLSQLSYAYDASGNVTSVTDGAGNTVTMTYDARGNLLTEVDSAGDTRNRTYNAANQVLTDTTYADAAVGRGAFSKAAALPETARSVYAAATPTRLRFAISAAGDVTEYRYDANGLRISEIVHAGARYDISGLALTAVPTETQMQAWQAGQDPTRSQRTEYRYDARGQLASRTVYASVAADGTGVAASGATTQYIHDARGLLLQRIEPGNTMATRHVYDGLGRLLSTSGPSLDDITSGTGTPSTTVTSHDDAGGRTTTTLANGLSTVSAYDRAGRLISVTQSSIGSGVLGTTRYAYDGDGRLVMTQDPTGLRRWTLYDAADRPSADIDATGALVEYVYGSNGQLRQTIAYATPVDAALFDAASPPLLASVRPATSAQDQIAWRFYDGANRLAWQVDAAGAVTQTTYDGASRILAVTRLATPIDVRALGNGADVVFGVDPATVGGLALAIGSAPSRYGDAVTLTATIDSAGSATPPGGMVSFFDGDTVVGSAMVVDGRAVLVTTALAPGVRNLRASYSGDLQLPASLSATSLKLVSTAIPQVGLSFSSSPYTLGAPVVLAASVTTSQLPDVAPPTGTVTFYSGSTRLGSATLINGLATLSTSALPASTPSTGALQLRAQYAGDTLRSAAVSGTYAFQVQAPATQTQLKVARSGTGLALAASVRPISGATTGAATPPGGSVSFYSGSQSLGSATLVNGTATLQFNGSIGAGPIRAVYGGDAANAGSGTSGASPTASTLSASATSIVQGAPLTLTAQVAGASPSGLVTFFSGMTVLGTAPVVNGTATLAPGWLPVGGNPLVAAYAGDANNLASLVTQGPTVQVAAPAAGGTGTGTVAAPPVVVGGALLIPGGVGSAGFPTAVILLANHAPATSPYTGTFSVFDGQTLIASFTNPNGRLVNLPPMALGTHALAVAYSGDAAHSAATGSAQLVVGPAASQVSVSASTPARTTFGSPVTLTANLAPDVALTMLHGASGEGRPPFGGSVTFYNDGVAIGTATVSNGSATLTVSNLALGMGRITASYAGDSSHGQASSTVLLLPVVASTGAIASASTLTATPPAASFGTAVVLTATVAAGAWPGTAGGSPPVPSGTVRFYNGDTLLGSAALAGGKATLSVSALPPGSATLRAVYSGDAGNATSTAAIAGGVLVVAKATTQTTLAASASSVVQGAPVTLTANVAGKAPGGLVTFLAGTTVLGTAPLVAGQARLVTTYLPVGNPTLSATYAGDANNLASLVLQGPSIAVEAGTTAVPPPPVAANGLLLVQGLPAVAGFPVRVTVFPTQAGGPASGSFSIFDGTTLLGSFVNPQLAALDLPALAVGTHALTIVYSGDASRTAATGTSQVVVTAVPVKVTVGSSRTQSAVGAPLILTASIAPDPVTLAQYGGAFSGPAASGTVTFYSKGVAIGTASLVNGQATLTLTSLPAGTASLTASYAGDSNYKLATSSAFSQQIVASPVATSMVLATSSSNPIAGATLVLTATPRGAGQPATGSVTFYDGTQLLGAAALVNGSASFSVARASAGAHSFRLVYAGDANNAASTSTASVTVAPAPTSLTRTNSILIATSGAVSVRVGTTNGVTPTGLVSFYDGSTLVGTAALIGGVATLSGVRWQSGARALTATYAGDAVNASSTLKFTQTVTGTAFMDVRVSLDIARDRTTTELHDRDGRLQATLDAEGFLTEYRYDAAGREVERIGYAAPIAQNARLATLQGRIDTVAKARAAVYANSIDLAGLRPMPSADDIHITTFYDDRGQVIGQVDGDGYLTETVYDARGNVTRTVRYANRAMAMVTAANATAELASIRPPASTGDQVTTQTWSEADLLQTRTDAQGTVTQHGYDNMGQRVQSTVAAGTAEARTLRQRYDLQGRLVGELDGRGSDAVAVVAASVAGAPAGTPAATAAATAISAAWSANGTTHRYDAAGRRVSSTDANGFRTLFFYDAAGRLATTVDALGEVAQRRYDALGQLAEEVAYGTRIDAATLAGLQGGLATAALAQAIAAMAATAQDSRTVQTYTNTGTLASRTDALGSRTGYAYNVFREATASSQTLASGYVLRDTSSFDRRGLAVSSVRDAGTLALTTQSSHDAFGRLAASTDANGNRTQWGYDHAGHVTRTTDPTGASRMSEFDAFGRLARESDALANVRAFSYDTAQRSVIVTTPEGVTLTTMQNRFGETQSVTDALGNVTRYSYDKSGNLIGTATPLDGTTTLTTAQSYDKTRRLVQSTDARGVTTAYTYDPADRLLTRTVDAGGLNLATRYAYDAKGLTVRVTDPAGIVTTTAYDLGGRVVRETVDPTGLNLQTVSTYDANGTRLTQTSPGGTLTRYSHDGAGRLIKQQVDPLGLNLTQSYAYDAAGNLIKRTDANGQATLFGYDKADRRVFEIDAVGGVRQFGYDANGRLVRQTDYATPLGSAALAGLNGVAPGADAFRQNQLAALGMGETQSWRYDRDGRLAFTIDGSGAVTESKYDTANRLIETRRYAARIDLGRWTGTGNPPVVADATRDERVRTVYDALGRATWRVDGAGNTVQMRYDGNGNAIETRGYANPLSASALAAWNGRTAPAVAADDARDIRLRTMYDAAGRATWTVDGVGNVTRLTYDADGRVTGMRRYATVLDQAALAAWNGLGGQSGYPAPQPVTDDARDQRLRSAYDAAGRITWTVDGVGAVTGFAYDANGNLTRRTQFDRAIADSAAPASVVASTADRTVDNVYDAADRLRYQLRSTGDASASASARSVTSYVYDGVGRVLRQTDHATPLNLGGANATPANIAAGLLPAADDRMRSAVYDAAGHATYSVDGAGGVTFNRYDGLGRVVSSTRFSRAVALSATTPPSAVTAAVLAGLLRPDATVDRTTVTAYDAAGRASFEVDALGSVTRNAYDAFGNLIQQVRHANRVAAPTANTALGVPTDASLRQDVRLDIAADRVDRQAYDAANRRVFSVDAVGAVTASVYDGVGNVTQTTAYANAVDLAGLGATATASAVDLAPRITGNAANDRVTRTAYDAAGRAVFTVDALGNVTRRRYDGLNLVGTSRYAAPVPAGTAITVAALSQVVVDNATTLATTRTTTEQFDAAGRKIAGTDALGARERWAYNALGDVQSHTNANGATWTYTYDRAGRMTGELAPEVALTTVTPGADGRLRVDEAQSGAGRLLTQLAYNVFGDLQSRTEAAGRPEARTTRYGYDGVGRQVSVIYPQVGIYDAAGEDPTTNGGASLAVRVERSTTLTTSTRYDALGNAVSNTDVAGNVSTKRYDRAGRVLQEVDALGGITGYERNSFGETTRLTRYGTPGQDADRMLATRYDRLGRAIEVVEPQGFVYDPAAANTQVVAAGKTTRHAYNVFGDLAQVAELKDAVAGTWAVTSYSFDRRGQQVATVDAMGYVGTDAYDAVGNRTRHVEYANAIAGQGIARTLAGWNGLVTGTGTDIGMSPLPTLNAADDRATTYAFDLADRKVSETRLNVEYGTAPDATSTRGDLTTSYGYDAVGNLTRTTDAAGASTYSSYDALGRVSAVTEPVRASTEDGHAVTPLTVFRRDAYGNLVATIEYANGAGAIGAPMAPKPMPAFVTVPNPAIATLAASGWVQEPTLGFFSAVPFAGGLALYQLIGVTNAQHIYTTGTEERDRLVNSALWRNEGAIGYVAQTQAPGTVPVQRLSRFSLIGLTHFLTTDPAEVSVRVGQGWSLDGPVGYVSTSATNSANATTAALDTPLARMAGTPFADHIYLAGTVKTTDFDPSLVAGTDRVSFARYDSLGHLVQDTDASGVSHHSSYNAQGLVAKTWQGVTDDTGTTRTLWRAYQYDALGRQTHVIDPGTASDNVDYTQGVGGSAVGSVYAGNPRAFATIGIQPQDAILTGHVQPAQDKGKLELDVANTIDAQGGLVRVDFDFLTYPHLVPGDGPDPVVINPPDEGSNGTIYHREPGTVVTQTSLWQTPAEALNGVSLIPNESMAELRQIRVFQQNAAGVWVQRWQGTPAQADGSGKLAIAPGTPGAIVDTALEYNRFGELTRKSVNGQTAEYFDYDSAGHLWRTNAGDGIDKIALYGLQGRQTAEIRSAGQARSDLDLRSVVWTPEQAANLADVRRTDTQYDLLGRVVRQTMPERLETQNGVTAHTGTLATQIAASSVPGGNALGTPIGWNGSNSVNLAWPGYLADLGSGEVSVTVTYVTSNRNGGEASVRQRGQVFGAGQAVNGVNLQWSDADGFEGGIRRITHLTVQKKDVKGNWQTVIDRDGGNIGGNIGMAVHVAAPTTAVGAPGVPLGTPGTVPGASVVLEWRPVGTSAWNTAALVNYGDNLRFDAGGLGEGRYEYRVTTTLPGQSPSPTASGTWNIGPRQLATIGTPLNINTGAQTLEWQGPAAPDTQVLRLRVAGSGGAWSTPPLSHPFAGANNSGYVTASLAGLAGGTYEYELLWTHAGDPAPYAHASGIIQKVDATPPQVIPGTPGVPGTPGTPPSGLPQIQGLAVETREEAPALGSPDGAPTLVRVVRLSGVPGGKIGTFGLRLRGAPVLLTPQTVQLRWDGYWEFNVTGNRLPYGSYEYVWAFTTGLGAPFTDQASGFLTVNWDGSIGIADTTPAYDPGTAGTPGTPGTPDTIIPGNPAQYAAGATDPGLYPLSQNRLIGGLSINQILGAGDTNGTSVQQRPVVVQNVDRWGNVTGITDPRSTAWKTTYRYNANNQLVQQVQTDSDGNAGVNSAGAGAQGVVNPNAPVTTLTYDKLGRQLAVRDANGNVNGNVYDAGGQLVQEVHADGGVISHAYDAFGDKTRTIDAMGHGTWYLNDKLGRLVKTIHQASDTHGWGPLGLRLVSQGQVAETQTWDQAGRLLSQTNGNGETIRYAYDLRGNLISTTQPMGQTTRAAFDANNRKVIEVDGNGAVSTWKYDSFGRLQGHTDIGRASYAYTYDHARQLTAQSSTRGQNIGYQYDAVGQVLQINDAGTGTVSSYRYDLAGRRVRETTTQGGVVYQDNHNAYDALGRLRWTADARSTVNIDYDKVGNRTRIRVDLNDLAQEKSDRYYAYDAMNRQTLVDGTNAAGGISAAQGHRLTYDKNGNRTSDTSIGPRVVRQGSGYGVDTGTTTESYGYDGLDRLNTTVRDGTLIDTRLYDAANRVLLSGPVTGYMNLPTAYVAAHQQGVQASKLNPALPDLGGPVIGRTSRYDANGRLVAQQNHEYGVLKNSTSYDRYDNEGNVLGYTSIDTGSVTKSETRNKIDRAEGYRTSIALTQTGPMSGPGAVSVGGIGYLYDTNGHLARTVDANQITSPTHRAHSFVNDASGNALYAYYSDDRNPGPQLNAQRQLIVNGEVLGRYGAEATQRFGNLLGPQFEAKSEFSFGYQPINGNYPAGSPGTYAVAAGDTLQSIAKGAYGDANLWYLIADANGLSSSADLRSGQVLTIPTRVASANNANSFKPYDPSNIIGETSPTLMAVPGHGDQGCGGVGQLVVIVIAVAVAYVTAGAAAGALAPYLGAGTAAIGGTAGVSVATAVAAGAVGGAVGSIVSQAVGVAIGAQESFNWKGVALGAIGGGVAGGLSGAGTLFNSGSAFAEGAVRGAVSSAVTQGVAVATGLQSSFSWRSVAASAVSAGAAQGLNAALGYDPQVEFNLGKSLVTGLGGSVVGQAVRGGKVVATTLATDAFGNVLSDSLAAANSSIPKAASAEERQTIISYFNDGPGTGKNAAVDYLNNTSWSGISDSSDPTSQAQRYVNEFGGATLNAGSRLEMGIMTGSGDAASRGALSDRMNASAKNTADLNVLASQVETERSLDNLADLAAAYMASGMVGATGDATDSIPANGDSWYPTDIGGILVGQRMTAAEIAAFDAQNSGVSATWAPPTTSVLDALSMGWSQQGWSMLANGSRSQQPAASFVHGLGQGSRELFDSVTGAGSMRQAQLAWQRGDYLKAPLYGMQSFGEAALNAFGAGELFATKAAVTGVVRGSRGLGSSVDVSASNYSRLSQPGGLAATEGRQVLKHNGSLSNASHPLAKHGPDVSNQDIYDRVANELSANNRAGIRTAFNDRAQMEAAVDEAFRIRQRDIDVWLAQNPRAGVPRAFEADVGMGNLGRGYEVASRGGPIVPVGQTMPGVNLVLMPDGRGGYFIHTAHPIK